MSGEEAKYTADQLRMLVGFQIIDVGVTNIDEFPALVVQKGTAAWQLTIVADSEGNGAGAVWIDDLRLRDDDEEIEKKKVG
jgi:hypothetical protein